MDYNIHLLWNDPTCLKAIALIPQWTEQTKVSAVAEKANTRNKHPFGPVTHSANSKPGYNRSLIGSYSVALSF